MNDMWLLLKESFTRWYSHNPGRSGAALSYYALFSLAPVFIIVITLVSVFFGNDIVQTNVMFHIQEVVGPAIQEFIKDLIISARSTNIFTGLVGGITVILVAFAVFRQLDESLNNLWESTALRPRKDGIHGLKKYIPFMREKILPFSLIPIIAFLLMISVSASIMFQSIGSYNIIFFSKSIGLFHGLDRLLSFGLTTLLFAFTYHLIPNRKLPWNEIFFGAFFTSILFLFGEYILSLYITKWSNTSLYGAAGSLVAFLVWIYYSSQIFFFGASFTYTYSKLFGHLKKA